MTKYFVCRNKKTKVYLTINEINSDYIVGGVATFNNATLFSSSEEVQAHLFYIQFMKNKKILKKLPILTYVDGTYEKGSIEDFTTIDDLDILVFRLDSEFCEVENEQ